jgi:hypothetical protein
MKIAIFILIKSIADMAMVPLHNVIVQNLCGRADSLDVDFLVAHDLMNLFVRVMISLLEFIVDNNEIISELEDEWLFVVL